MPKLGSMRRLYQCLATEWALSLQRNQPGYGYVYLKKGDVVLFTQNINNDWQVMLANGILAWFSTDWPSYREYGIQWARLPKCHESSSHLLKLR